MAGAVLQSSDVVSSAPELARLTLNIAATHHDSRVGGQRLVYGGHTIGPALAQASRLPPNLATVLALSLVGARRSRAVAAAAPPGQADVALRRPRARDELKAAGRTVEGSVNDAYVAALLGGIRRYHDAAGDQLVYPLARDVVVAGDLGFAAPFQQTAVITSCAFDMADLPLGEGVNYVARHPSTMS
jgi:hypothetical protein